MILLKSMHLKSICSTCLYPGCVEVVIQDSELNLLRVPSFTGVCPIYGNSSEKIFHVLVDLTIPGCLVAALISVVEIEPLQKSGREK